MKYYKNLLQTNTSNPKLRLSIGVIFLCTAIAWLFIKYNQLEPFDWFYFALFSLTGITHILGGMGYKIEQLIGSSYLFIDEKEIKLKLNYFKKEEVYQWKNITNFSSENNQFVFHQKDSSSFTLPLSKIEYKEVQKIKEILSKIKTEYQINHS